jgi:hypothetical protein
MWESIRSTGTASVIEEAFGFASATNRNPAHYRSEDQCPLWVEGLNRSVDRRTAGVRKQDARVTGLACLSDRNGGRDNRRPNQFVSIGFVGEEEESVIGPIGQWLKGNVPAQ